MSAQYSLREMCMRMEDYLLHIANTYELYTKERLEYVYLALQFFQLRDQVPEKMIQRRNLKQLKLQDIDAILDYMWRLVRYNNVIDILGSSSTSTATTSS